VPTALPFVPTLPYATRAVTLPSWFAEVGPRLSSHDVVLAYPPPFSGIQSSMTWQAVDGMAFAQAGGGGPQGTARRAGKDRPGFTVLARLGFGFGQAPQGTSHELAAVRTALRDWGVTVVVVPRFEHTTALFGGDDAAYDAAFMTAAIGRRPRIERGAWVWYHVDRPVPALHVAPGELNRCEPPHHGGPELPMARVTDCVALASSSRPARPRG
jgi:hypothetical protein